MNQRNQITDGHDYRNNKPFRIKRAKGIRQRIIPNRIQSAFIIGIYYFVAAFFLFVWDGKLLGYVFLFWLFFYMPYKAMIHLCNPPVSKNLSISRKGKTIRIHMKFRSMLKGCSDSLNTTQKRAQWHFQLQKEFVQSLQFLNQAYSSNEFETTTWLLSNRIIRLLKENEFQIKMGKLGFVNHLLIVSILARNQGMKKAEMMLVRHPAYKITWNKESAEKLIEASEKCLH